MHNLTPEKEALILEALRARIATVPGAVNVIADEPLLDSKQDVLDTICVQNADDETEVKYLKIDFLGFEDSPTDGCEDNPLVYATYNLHLFQQFNAGRSDETTSTKDIKKLLFALRNLFLETANNARQLAPGSESLPLTQNNFILLDNDPLTGYYGHFVDLKLRVEIL